MEDYHHVGYFWYKENSKNSWGPFGSLELNQISRITFLELNWLELNQSESKSFPIFLFGYIQN
jgi:hypothetical protein